MQEMADPQRTPRAQVQQLRRKPARIGAITCLTRRDRADPHRVENRGDPHARQFGIMRNNSAGVGPVDLGARLNVAFQIVGVQLDQPRCNQVALAIHRAHRNAGAVGNLGDMAIHHTHSAPARFVGQNQRGVGEDKIRHGWFLEVSRGIADGRHRGVTQDGHRGQHDRI
ncbi:hypothetical protein GALL_434710 [mine drainage metagenome]|uniref:Uncharacterized protein n=1 Tax=mine drainage metagenome TaxID=410659 RepID=A0A1J5PUS1_9ZZZZ